MSMDRNVAAALPRSEGEIQALKHLAPAEVKEAERLALTIDVRDALSITTYGLRPQKEMSALADPILKLVSTKDAGVAGKVLTELLTEIKGLNAGSLGTQVERGISRLPLIGRLFSRVQQFISRYETVKTKIDRTVIALEASKHTLIRDVVLLDKMYDQNGVYFRQMLIHVAAGDMKLQAMRDEHDALVKQAGMSGDPIHAQKASDFANAVTRLERRVHDLKLAAMVSLQSAPQIRLVQNSDQQLVEKIQSSILTTIPLWKSQIIIAISLFNQNKAATIQREISRTTNALIRENMEMVREGSIASARESERGFVEIDTLRVVNQQLIDTIEDTIRIHEEARHKRAEVELELEELQGNLKDKLSQVRTTQP
jgi:uncharacterized protein YaaN involved in tellurite resistance